MKTLSGNPRLVLLGLECAGDRRGWWRKGRGLVTVAGKRITDKLDCRKSTLINAEIAVYFTKLKKNNSLY